MTYPSLPLVITTVLSENSADRAKLSKDVHNVTVIMHNGTEARMQRIELVGNDQWGNVTEIALRLYNAGDVDTATLFFPGTEGDVDFGIHMRPNTEPLFLEWVYAPRFSLRMAGPEVSEQLKSAVGVEVIQGLLNRHGAVRSKQADTAANETGQAPEAEQTA